MQCSPAFGMDYTSGNTRPMLPALPAGQAVAFRWTFDANTDGAPMAASAILKPAALPDPTAINLNAAEALSTRAVPPAIADPPVLPATIGLAEVPMLAAQGAGETLNGPVTGIPWARTAGGIGAIGNGLLRVRVSACRNGAALLSLDSGSGAAWNAAAYACGVIRVCTASPGQSAWWRRFTVATLAASETPDSAVLTLHGKVGRGWNAIITLTVTRDTGVIQGQVQLTAVRNMELATLQLPMLYPANADSLLNAPVGVPQPVPIPAEEPIGARLAMVKDGSATALSWSATPPLPGWTAQPVEPATSSIPAPSGVEWSAGVTPVGVNPGTSITIPFRLLVLPGANAAAEAPRLVQP
ncbi:MAG: hypothetical protein KGJ62_10965 [Armatimonadetes bacterium]|nr:hypothetical protein [Armatimonadota bacterium]MDE2206831.1 hypothetical protein [Armatimonadota bacterium]